MPVRCLAEMLTNMTSPPYSSATRPYSVSWERILSGFAPSLSILLTATTMGHSGRLVVDRLNGLRHDTVIGRDHEIAMSVTWARGTHGVKASCPGCSMKVMRRGFRLRLTLTTW